VKNGLSELIIFIFIFSIASKAQEVQITPGGENNFVHVIGDSLIGKIVNGENIREVIGNVIITQGDVHITCERAVQHLAKNEVELIGNVILTQDSIVVKTAKGYYKGNERTAYSLTGISLFDGHVTLTADSGYYYFEGKKSHFYGSVTLKDTTSILHSKRLIYFDDEDKAIASGSVNVVQKNSSLFADSLIHFRKTGVTLAYKNIVLLDKEQKLLVMGNELIDSSKTSHSIIHGEPLLVQVDTTRNGKPDTLFISSKEMESVKDSAQNKMIARDSVKIVRGEVSSLNNYTFYDQSKDFIFTYRKEDDTLPPILWYGESQLVGDSIHIYLKDNDLDWINIDNNAFILSFNKNYDYRYDQISGKNIKMYFNENGLYLTEVNESVLSIYYLFEGDRPNGLLKSSSERAKIFFDSTKVTDVKLYGSPASEYHPEKLIEGKEKDFTLPSFIVYNNRPKKEDLLNGKRIPFYLIEMK